eukprot:745841-Prorocentrum_lima.AAC.1
MWRPQLPPCLAACARVKCGSMPGPMKEASTAAKTRRKVEGSCNGRREAGVDAPAVLGIQIW